MPYLFRSNVYGRSSLSKQKRHDVINNLLLDIVTGANIAYGLRKLRSGYTGHCIKVRRNNDNEELDIGFDGNSLDTTALSNFAGDNSAFVTTWYDQSGNGDNAVQATTDLQPLVVNEGSYLGGVFFRGNSVANVRLSAGTVFNNKDNYTVHSDLTIVSNANDGQIYCKGTTDGHGLYVRPSSNKLRHIQKVPVGQWAWEGETTISYSTRFKYTVSLDSNLTFKNYKNGNSEDVNIITTGTGTNVDDSSENLLLGNWRAFDGGLNGTIHEIIFYDKILNETEINNVNTL